MDEKAWKELPFSHGEVTLAEGVNGPYRFNGHENGVESLDAKSTSAGVVRMFFVRSDYDNAVKQKLDLANPATHAGWLVTGDLHYPQDLKGNPIGVPADFLIWSSQSGGQVDLDPSNDHKARSASPAAA